MKWRGRLEYAHRIAWEIEHGAPPSDCVLHSCDNRACANARHLFEGDRNVNNQDMIAKGRAWWQR